MKKTFLPLLVILGGCGLAFYFKHAKKPKHDIDLFYEDESSRKFPRCF